MSAIQQLLTNHIDIWTAADTAKKSGRGRSSGTAGSVYGIKKLRELILELAVRGKLVPQDANDEPASELLKKIAAEKAKLLAEGKIKKSKSLAEITDDEKPFELPTTWKWLRLPDIYFSLSVSKNKLLSSEIKETGLYPVVDQGQRFIAGYTDNEGLLIYLPGPVVVFGDHTTERKLIDFDFVAGADGVKILRPILQIERFFWLQLKGLKIDGRGYARHFKILNECFYALPPINEQNRIVAKVDELMALCDQLENQHNNAAEAHEKLVAHLLGTLTQSQNAEDFNTHWQRISEHFDTLFTTEASIDALKQTLLQLAVMGKLVPQDPNDEPASELLKRIQAEKAKLAAKGKIKKDKPLAEITEEEKPFDLPDGWEWIRMGDICRPISSGSTPSAESFKYDDGIPFLKVYNIRNQEIDFNYKMQFIDKELHDSKLKRSIIYPNDVVMNIVGPPLGKVAIIPDSFPEWNCNQAIVFFGLIKPMSPYYILNFLKEGSFLNNIELIGTAGQDNISVTKSKNIVAPIPPINEQYRIVVKIDELMAICDQLKTSFTLANQLQQKLADVVVENTIC